MVARVANDTTPWDVTDGTLAYLIGRADKLAAFVNNPTAEEDLAPRRIDRSL